MSNTKEESKDSLNRTMELGEKAKKAQSAVSLAAGSLDIFEIDEGKQENVKKPAVKKPNHRRNGKYQGKPRVSNYSEDSRRKEEPKLKPVTSRNTLEERLAYYKQKYGEDFRPAAVEEAVPAERS